MILTIEEIIPNGVMSKMKELDQEKVDALFTADEVNSFDRLLMAYIGEFRASYGLAKAYVQDNVDSFIKALLDKYYASWTHEKTALELKYDILNTKGEKRILTETRDERNNDTESENIQNSMNAYDSAISSDTDKTTNSRNGEHSTESTLTRNEDINYNGTGLTQSQLISKEIQLRIEYCFFDIVFENLRLELASCVF